MGRLRLRIFPSALLLAVVFAILPGAAFDDPTPPTSPALAKVTAWATRPSGDPSAGTRVKTTEGFGFVVESNGLLVTTYQAVRDPEGNGLLHDIDVELLTRGAGRSDPYRASIVAIEPTLDISILKIDPSGELDVSVIADRESIRADQTIHAPVGIIDGGLRFTRGVLTDLNSMECYQESMTATMYQARLAVPDVALGAPVFGDNGEIVAMHTGYTPPPDDADEEKKDDAQHLLPIHLVFNIYESLKFRKSLESPWTGFSVRPLDAEEASIFPTQERFLGGIGIDFVWADSPAEKLGIRKDDILVRFSYYPITSPADFQKWLYMHGVGYRVKLHFIRNRSEYRVVEYVIEERPATARPR